MASPPRTPIPPAAQVKQYSWRNYAKKEVCLYIRTLKPLKTKKEEGKLKFNCPGATSCQHHSDVIVSDVIVNKPVARKQCAQKKHSLVSKKGFLKSTLSMYSQTFTKVALMLAVVISILGGVLTVKLPGRISTIGTSSLVCQSSELASPRTPSRSTEYSTRSQPTLTRNVLAGKHLDTYIFPSAYFWASRVNYLDTYTVNLEFDDKFPVVYNLLYIYCDNPAEIFKLPASAGESCKSAEGFPTPVTSPLSPPKPPRTRVKQYVWRNSAKKEVCMYIRIVNPGEIRKEKEEMKFKNQEETNCQNRSDVIGSSVTIVSPSSDVTIRERGINKPITMKRHARKRSLMLSEGNVKS